MQYESISVIFEWLKEMKQNFFSWFMFLKFIMTCAKPIP